MFGYTNPLSIRGYLSRDPDVDGDDPDLIFSWTWKYKNEINKLWQVLNGQDFPGFSTPNISFAAGYFDLPNFE